MMKMRSPDKAEAQHRAQGPLGQLTDNVVKSEQEEYTSTRFLHQTFLEEPVSRVLWFSAQYFDV